MLRTLHQAIFQILQLAMIFGFASSCAAPAATPTQAATPPARLTAPAQTPTSPPRSDGLSEAEAITLDSLEKIDDYPLYTLRYHGAYDQRRAANLDISALWAANPAGLLPGIEPPASASPWACSLFAALGDPRSRLFGRNFDWDFSPALLLFTAPPGGFASVAMVDIAYLGFGGARAATLTDLPLVERRALLDAPFLPFDGMNEQGLVVGMAAVPPGGMSPDPARETIGSLGVMRAILDQASDVDEALAILGRYNIDMDGGPPLHYLIADATGRAVLVEFYQGELVAIPNDHAWHLATNFLRASADGSAAGVCSRYDALSERLTEAQGSLTAASAMDLLSRVAQAGTQWSIVYGITTGEISVAMGRQYNIIHTFQLNAASH